MSRPYFKVLDTKIEIDFEAFMSGKLAFHPDGWKQHEQCASCGEEIMDVGRPIRALRTGEFSVECTECGATYKLEEP